MIPSALHPDAVTAKTQTLKDWRDALARTARREPETDQAERESLTGWTVTRTDAGELYVSARIVGPDPFQALLRFETRQSARIEGFGDLDGGDRLPALDCTVPGRTACVWRTGGVWVELWHPDTPTGPTAPPTPRQGRTATPADMHAVITRSPSGRLTVAQRLTAIRRNATTKEN